MNNNVKSINIEILTLIFTVGFLSTSFADIPITSNCTDFYFLSPSLSLNYIYIGISAPFRWRCCLHIENIIIIIRFINKHKCKRQIGIIARRSMELLINRREDSTDSPYRPRRRRKRCSEISDKFSPSSRIDAVFLDTLECRSRDDVRKYADVSTRTR